MANSYNTMPIVLDTDVSDFGTSQTLQSRPFGLRITKLALVANGTTVAGTVTITNVGGTQQLTNPMLVGAGLSANQTLYTDNMDGNPLTWQNFAVTGLTSTNTKLYLWYRV
jgi:hypothetical protein